MEKIVCLIKVTAEDGSVTWIGKNETTICDPWSHQLFDFAKENGFESEDAALETPNSLFDMFGDQYVIARVTQLLVW